MALHWPYVSLVHKIMTIASAQQLYLHTMGCSLKIGLLLQTYSTVDACIKFKQDEDLQDAYDMSLAVVAAAVQLLLPTQWLL